jgi:MFS family permease
VLFLSRLIDGFTAGNASTASAYVADVTPPQDRARNFGFIGMAYGLGFILGPALGGLLSGSACTPAYTRYSFVLGAVLATSSCWSPQKSVRHGLACDIFVSEMLRPTVGVLLIAQCLFFVSMQ